MNGAARVGVRVRRPLALEVGEERQALDARLPALGLCRQLLEGRARRERVAKPAQRSGGVEHHAHRLPRVRERVAEGMNARLAIVRVRRERGEDDTRRAEDDRDDARLDHPDAERRRLLVARSGDLGGLVHRRKPVARDLERGEHVVAPAPVRDVEEERSGGVRGVDRPLARQAQADVVLRQRDPADAPVDVGLVSAQPEQLRRREAGERPVAGERDQPLEADALLDLGALGAGALVVPEDRRAEDAVLRRRGRRDRASGRRSRLGAASTPRRASALSLARSQSSGSCSDQPGCGVESGYALLCGRDDLALRRDRDRLDAGRPDVEADERRHSPPSAAYTSSYARTASLRCWASRSAASSILAATESMNRHCRTLRLTAATASSVYG